MKKIACVSLAILLIISSCKKSTPDYTIPPGNPNNQMNAMVSVKGGAFSSFTATGSSTVYSKRTDPNGDIVITCLGSTGLQNQITITFVNVSAPGVYTIGTTGGAGAQYVMGFFGLGFNLLGFNESFFAQPPPLPAGTVTIDELTSNSIKGSFSMTCTGSTGTIQITNGSFKGNF